MNLNWLLRMSRWARHPPSPTKVKIICAVIVLAAVIYGLEWMGWWPEWATVDGKLRRF